MHWNLRDTENLIFMRSLNINTCFLILTFLFIYTEFYFIYMSDATLVYFNRTRINNSLLPFAINIFN